MIPSLPTELIARILVMAEEDELASNTLKIRSRLERVCKEWYNMVDYFTTVAIARPGDLTRFTSKFSSRKMRDLFGFKARTVLIDCSGFYKNLNSQITPVLRWLGQTEVVQLTRLTELDDLSGGPGSRRSQLLDAFKGMKHIKHLEVFARHDSANASWQPKADAGTFSL